MFCFCLVSTFLGEESLSHYCRLRFFQLDQVDDATFWPKDAEGKHLYDTEASYIETWQEMEKLVEEGLVETIGCVEW